MHTNKTTKILGYLGLLAAVMVGAGEHLLHYSDQILGHAENYAFFKYVPKEHLTWGHIFAIVGLPFYFAGYLHIYQMLRTGNETLARIVLGVGFIAFAVGGVWIGSRASIGNIVQLQSTMNAVVYETLLSNYTNHMEVLVKVLRVVIAVLSIVFAVTILKGGTMYKKWMAFCNPIVILVLLVGLGQLLPAIGKHLLPILMNVTHFVLFSLSLYQLHHYVKPTQYD